MKFFSKDLSERLHKLGCVSGTDFYHGTSGGITRHFMEEVCEVFIPAFCIYDFLSDESYCDENLNKIFKNETNSVFWCIKTTKQFLAIDDKQEAYIEKAVDKLLKE